MSTKKSLTKLTKYSMIIWYLIQNYVKNHFKNPING